jgi:Tol biopolymer transport system component
VATGREEKVLDGLAPGCWACWALQGERLYSVSMGAAAWTDARLTALDLRTRKAEELATVPKPLAPLGTGALSVSPDGKRFLMVRVNRANTDVLRVEGFR